MYLHKDKIEKYHKEWLQELAICKTKNKSLGSTIIRMAPYAQESRDNKLRYLKFTVKLFYGFLNHEGILYLLTQII